MSNRAQNYPGLAIVVVSYGSAVWLPECLKSLQADVATYPSTVDIGLVENKTDHATLATSQQLAEQYKLKWLPASTNLGYGAGANFGWQHLSGDIYLVVNPDMAFPVGWLAKLIAPFGQQPKVGIVGCKLLDKDGKIQHAGGILKDGELLGEHFGAGEPDDGRWDEGAVVDFVTGAALAIRHPLLQKLGGFDPRYFPGYYEDVDLCWRARQLGWQTWYEPSAVAYHFEGGSFGRGASYFRAFHRNRLRFAIKNLPTERLLHEFLPAERHRLRALPDNADRRASEAVFAGAKHAAKNLSNNRRGKKDAKPGKDFSLSPQSSVFNLLLKEESEIMNYNLDGEKENALTARLGQRLSEVKNSWLVEEKPFHSRLPLVATLRERFNSISTRWYVKPILQQQVDYNAAVARVLEDMGQLVMAQEASQNLEFSVLAGKIEQIEARLDRLEALLEKLVNK